MSDVETIDGEAELVDEEVVKEVRNLPAVRASEAVVVRGEISVEELLAQRSKIVEVMDKAMKDGVHYGRIPGIDKPTLYKPGGELLNVLFRLSPSYKSEKIWHDDGHLTVVSVCTLTHIQTGLVIAEGEGLCSTREGRYAYRTGGRSCPACGAEGTIKKSKYPPRASDYAGADPSDPPGWYCFVKINGCGANFAHDDPEITKQAESTKIANPDLPDTYNTVLKMADKRAMIAAVLNGTAASDVFTQDVEDTSGGSPDGPQGPQDDRGGADAGDTSSGKTSAEKGAEPFNPEALLPDAPKTQTATVEMFKTVEKDINWTAVIGPALAHVYDGVTETKKLPQEMRKAAWTRLANTAITLWHIAYDNGDFPAISDKEIQEAFAKFFGGIVVEVAREGAE